MEQDRTRNRAHFRQCSRRVLREPQRRELHLQRLEAAAALEGVEPLQGALVDMLHAHPLGPSELRACVASRPALQRLAPHVLRALQDQARTGRALPRVSVLATRWSVLVTPSLDVPARAMLCGVDDSRDLCASVLPALLAGDEATESAFLAHCEGAGDTMAFMLARRALTRANRALSPRWQAVASVLQRRVGT